MVSKGSCHCGKVKFEINLESPIKEVLSCNCSICQRKGSLLTFVPKAQFKLISGEDKLTDYQFGKKSIHHYFCSICGVTAFAFANAPDGTPMTAINVRCVDDVNLDHFKINKFDGKKL